MKPGSAFLDGERVAALLAPGGVVGRRIEVREQVASTNDEVAAFAQAGEAEGVVVVAESQEHGRGRRGSQWVSPPGKDLLFSILLRPGGNPETWTWLVHGAAVAICRVIEAALAVPAGIKWPNDVYLPGNKKVCGILMETVVGAGKAAGSHAVLGIGLNVNGSDFPREIRDRSACLREVAGLGELEREPLLAALLGELDAVVRLEGAKRAAVLREAERRSVLQGRRLAVGEGPERVLGRYLGLGEQGELRLLEDSGREWVFSGAEHVELVEGENVAKS